jgi:hypothetical protein
VALITLIIGMKYFATFGDIVAVLQVIEVNGLVFVFSVHQAITALYMTNKHL